MSHIDFEVDKMLHPKNVLLQHSFYEVCLATFMISSPFLPYYEEPDTTLLNIFLSALLSKIYSKQLKNVTYFSGDE